MVPKNVAQVLKASIEVLMRDGWGQGTDVDEGGRKCALGAIDAVTGNTRLRVAARDALVDALPDTEVCTDPENSIVHFNDGDRATKRKVLGLFRRALKGVLNG